MGCDIHLFVEKRNEQGVWEIVKGTNPRIEMYREWASDAYKEVDFEQAMRYEKTAFEIETGEAVQKSLQALEKDYPKEEREKDADLQSEYESELSDLDFEAPERAKNWLYDGRNYDLFGMLANVRNGRGFAGISTGSGFVPIAMQKGLPKDTSQTVKQNAEQWDGDGHSHSHLTVKELLDYDWLQTTKQYSVVNEKQFEIYKEKGFPEFYVGDIHGLGVVHVTPGEMELIVNGSIPKEVGKEYYTKISWNEPYYEAAGDFYTKSLSILKELAKDKPEDVRIVFWFDN